MGKELKILCPFHKDKNPSLNISTVNGKWKCWSCQTAGRSMESFLRRLKGNDAKISEYLTDYDLIVGRINSLYMSSEKKFFEYENYHEFKDILKSELERNFVPAESNKISLEYLTGESRKLTVDTIQRFKLMYAVSGDYEGRVIVPYYLDNEIIGFNGRKIGTSKESGKDDRYKYCIYKDAFKEFVYGIEGVKSPVILVEGPFDLMWMKQLGYSNTVSTLNTSIRPMQLYHLLKFDKIVFLFDNDQNKAGYNAVLKNADMIFNIDYERQIFIGNLPDYKDPNSSTEDEIRSTMKSLKRLSQKKQEMEIRF